MKLIKSIALISLCVALQACTTTNTDPLVYTTGGAMTAQNLRYATIIAISDVRIKEEGKNVIGALLGGGLGFVLGSAIGKGYGKDIAKVGGAIVGAAAGSKTQDVFGVRKAKQIIVNLDATNKPLAIIQDASIDFVVGERVVLIGSNDKIRVQRLN